MLQNNEKIVRGQTVPKEEKGYSGELSTLGKLSYFTEYFNKISIEEDDIKRIVPIDKPLESKSFKEGYQRGKVLVAQGFTKENYISFLAGLRTKTKAVIEEVHETKKRHR